MHRVGFVVPQAFQMMSVAALTVFEIANLLQDEPVYDVHLLSEAGGLVASSVGARLETRPLGEPAFDTVIIGSNTQAPTAPSSVLLLEFVRMASHTCRRVASICSGAFVLAEAGLLQGRRATLHWAHANSFRSRFPDVRVEEERLFIQEGPVWTSAGMTAGIDLVLALIATDMGAEAAKAVARVLVMNERRLGGQRQHSALLDMTPKSNRIEAVLAHIRENLRRTLSVPELAAVAKLSPRQFSRAFVAETGESPAKAVERLRLEAARFMLEEGHHPVNVVARETGFADRERMRRAFVRAFGLPPQALRSGGERLSSETSVHSPE